MRRVVVTAMFMLVLAVVLIASAPVRADGVVYTLTGSTNPTFGPMHPESFQFTAPDFITSTTSLSDSDLNSCTSCALSGTAIEFFPTGSINIIIPLDIIRFSDANGIVYGFFFSPGAFSAAGTYTASNHLPFIVSNVGTLTVQKTPEPSAAFLLSAGLLALLSARKKKTAHQA